MKLTWMGTAAFGIESKDLRILFDPFLELAGGETPIAEDAFLPYDTIFVTHCHFDHLLEAQELLAEGGGSTTLFATKQCCRTLESFLGDQSNVVQIRPGRTYDLYNEAHADEGHAHPSAGEPGHVRIRVLRGRHIDFQLRHLTDTMRPGRVLRYAGNLPFLLWANRTFREAGEIVAYDIHAEGREILLLGSLALDAQETYPEGVDVLILPYQGNNDLVQRAREVLKRIRPRSVVLSHFDNAFPPMSRKVDLGPFSKMMRDEFPKIRVIRPSACKAMHL